MVTQLTRRKSIALRLVLLVFTGMLLVGCGSPAAYITTERKDKGLILLLPGIEGPSMNTTLIGRGLAEGALPYAIETYDWREGRIGAQFAFDQAASRECARAVASHVANYRSEYPGRPVFVVGHSGGGAMAVFAAEAMPKSAPLDGVVVLSGPLDPRYDLTKAVRGSSEHLVNSYAWNDFFLRSLTTMGGNMDGTHGATAGQEGFTLPKGASRERALAFAHVVQIAWDRSMVRYSNWGGHFGCTHPRWVAAKIAPVIRGWGSDSARAVASR